MVLLSTLVLFLVDAWTYLRRLVIYDLASSRPYI